MGGRARAECAWRRIYFEGCPPTPPLISVLRWLPMGERSRAIDAPDKNLAAVGSISNAPASSLPACAGKMPPPRHLAPLDPSHPDSLPAFDNAAPHPGSGRVFRLVPHLHTLPPAPPPAAESWESASGSLNLQSTVVGSRFRLRSLGVKRCPRRFVVPLSCGIA